MNENTTNPGVGRANLVALILVIFAAAIVERLNIPLTGQEGALGVAAIGTAVHYFWPGHPPITLPSTAVISRLADAVLAASTGNHPTATGVNPGITVKN
jgi:hypothetical protein